MEGYRAIPELLRRSQLGIVFSMLGGTNVPWIAQGVVDGSLRLIKTRHEQTAVGAAGGYARATGQVGLCSVTRGPGFTNCINALVVATQSHVPILLIVGESPTTRQGSTQNVDQRGLTAAVGAGFHHVEEADELEEGYWAALRAVHWDGCPQVLSIKSSLLVAEIPLSREVPPLRPVTRPASEGVRAAVDALAGASHPLILAGSGVLLADCRAEVEEMASLTGARLATSLRANRLFEGHASDLGLSGGWSPPPVRELLAEADLVLAVGTSLNDFVTANGRAFPNAVVIHCEIDPDHRYATTVPDIVLHGDAGETMQALIAEWLRRGLPARQAPTPGPDGDAIRTSARAIDLGHEAARGLDPREVFIAFDDKLPKDRVIVTDTGRSLGTLPSLIGARDARSWLVGNSFQSVGQGLGAAIGAAAAYPDRPVVLFAGDGGFTMSAQDLEAVRMNDLHLTVVIINDQQYGSEMHHLEQFDLPMDVIRQPIPDVGLLARAFGGFGIVVETAGQLAEFEFARGGLQLIDIRVDPEINVREVPNAWSRLADAAGSVVARPSAF